MRSQYWSGRSAGKFVDATMSHRVSDSITTIEEAAVKEVWAASSHARSLWRRYLDLPPNCKLGAESCQGSSRNASRLRGGTLTVSNSAICTLTDGISTASYYVDTS